MTTTLTQTYKDQLSQWIDRTKRYKFTLLYKISRDGCNAQTFHSYCDNKGPTVTVLYNTNNTVYGGYTAANWNSNGQYISDASAFLFRLDYNGTVQPMKFPLKNTQYPIYGRADYGPTFGGGHDSNISEVSGDLLSSQPMGYSIYEEPGYGPTYRGGHDLYCFQGTVNKTGNYFPLNGFAKVGHSYDMQGHNYNTVMNGHLNVLDLEVYTVQETTLEEQREEEELLQKKKKAEQILDKPWIRNIEWSSSFEEQMKDSVAAYKPLPGLDLQQARILLVGQVGAGKSSYFNTINSIFRGYVSAQANAGSAEHSLTTSYRVYKVRDGYAGKSLNFRLCDTRGLEEDQGLNDLDISYLLEGHVPDKHKFNPANPMSPDTHGFVKTPTLSDKIHCVAFVLDGSTVDVLPKKVMERIKAMQLKMNQSGIPQVALLTKVDRICEEISDDISKVFFSRKMKDCVDRVSMLMGLPRSHILPVKNYESEVELDQNINILSLLSLKRILNFADDYLYNTLDEVEIYNLQRMQIRE